MLATEDIVTLDDASKAIEAGRLTKKSWSIVRDKGFNAVCCGTPYNASHGGCLVCGAW
jgi:hypothetical protein